MRNLGKDLDRELEDRAPVHLQEGPAPDDAVGDAARHRQDIAVTAVGMEVRRQNAGRIGRHEDDRTCSVAEEHAGSPVVPVEDPRIDFRADDQRVAGRAAFHHRIGQRKGIDEPAAHGLHVERGSAIRAELRLQNASGRREDHVRCSGRDDDEVDVGRRNARCGQGVPRRGEREVARLLIRRGNVSLTYPCARLNPLVAGLDATRELGVGQDLRRQVSPRASDPAMHSRTPMRQPEPPAPASPRGAARCAPESRAPLRRGPS